MSDSDRHHHHHKKSKKHKRDRSRDRSPRGDSDGSRKSEESSKKDREKEKSVEKSGSVDVKELVPNPNICPKLIKRITKYLQNWNKDVRIRIFIILVSILLLCLLNFVSCLFFSAKH